MAEAFERWANPSSPHAEGRAARRALEDARARIKAALGWDGELIFTASATEAAALAVARCRQVGPKAAVSSVEHDAIRRQVPEGEGWTLAVTPDGRLDPRALADWLHLAPRGLIAVQHANSETGVLQDVAGIIEAVDAAGSFLLVDCAQTAGKLRLPPADLAIVSAHKFGGPPGIAALLCRDLNLLVPTGGQERGYRGGTENLPAILGMAAALEHVASERETAMPRQQRLREGLEHRLTSLGATVIGKGARRSPLIGAYAMPGLSAQAQLVRFDGMGFAVSAGSACASGSMKPSHVLAAMGLDEELAARVIRVSFSLTTSEAEIQAFGDAWASLAADTPRRAA
jgi:cysteine desulfurase